MFVLEMSKECVGLEQARLCNQPVDSSKNKEDESRLEPNIVAN